jgi:hypothetical protein
MNDNKIQPQFSAYCHCGWYELLFDGYKKIMENGQEGIRLMIEKTQKRSAELFSSGYY